MTLKERIITILKGTRIQDPFLTTRYQDHNLARLSHLESLRIDFWGKKILEIGAGIGDHTYYYLLKNCTVMPTDARSELINHIKNRFGIDGKIIDADHDFTVIENLGEYDFVHCYGLLYHLIHPSEFLEAISYAGKTLLLETCVSPDQFPIGIHLIDEDLKDPTQAKSGVGCRPSRKWIENELLKHYQYIYFPKSQPRHPEFPVDWSLNTDQGLCRCVFIASHIRIENNQLTAVMPIIYEELR